MIQFDTKDVSGTLGKNVTHRLLPVFAS
jgi:hypothetical protein